MNATPDFVERLADAIRKGMAAGGADAEVTFESVPTSSMYRFAVISPVFAQMSHSERQEVVWKIATGVLDPLEQLRVSMILTLPPDGD